MKEYKEDATESHKLLSEEAEEKPMLSVWRQRLSVFSFVATQFAAMCTDTFLFPFFPQKAEEKGLTDTQIGLVFSSFELSRFISSLIAGYLVGKLNSKTICLTGSALTTIGCLAFGLVTYAPDSTFLPLCITMRMIAGAGTALLAVSGLSLLMKGTTYKINTLASLGEMTIGVGYIGGTAVGAALYELVGYTSVFWILGSLMVMMNVLQMLALPRLDIEPQPDNSALKLLRVPGVLILSTSCFALVFEGGARSAGISQYVYITFGKSPSIVGIWFSLWCVVYLIFVPLWNKVLNKGFLYTALILVWPVNIISVLLVGPSPLLNFIFHGKRYFLMTVGSVLVEHIFKASLFTAPYQASINLAVVNGHKEDSMQTYGMVTGVINAGLGLGGMTGPLIGGVITEILDYTWTITVVALVQTAMYVTMVMYLVYMKLTKQPLAPEEILDMKEDNSSETDDREE